MKNSNIFTSGESYVALLVNQIYSSLMSREWVTYKGELAKFLGKKEEQISKISCEEHVSDIKKAFPRVTNAIEEKCPASIKTKGGRKGKAWKYIGDDDDPLADERACSRKAGMEDYVRFCKSTMGLLPAVWLPAFFEDTTLLGEARKDIREGKVFVSASGGQLLKNLDLLPQLYECIEKGQPVSFQYARFGEATPEQVTFHPQYLKEFNGRWFVLGKRDGCERSTDVFPIDRIAPPVEAASMAYIPAERGYYERYFRDIVGVSHEEGKKVETITVRTKSAYIHGLMTTKPLHPSLRESSPYDAEKGFGEITFTLEPNREFYGRALSFGADLEIVSPDDVRERIREKASQLAELYGIMIGSSQV